MGNTECLEDFEIVEFEESLQESLVVDSNEADVKVSRLSRARASTYA